MRPAPWWRPSSDLSSRLGRPVPILGLDGAIVAAAARPDCRSCARRSSTAATARTDRSSRAESPERCSTTPAVVAARAVRLAALGVVDAADGTDVTADAASLCLHGDSPAAVAMARAVRAALDADGIGVRRAVVTGLRLLPMGDRAMLAEVASLDDVLALHAALAASRPAGVVDLVPAARTVLVRIEPRVLSLAAARAWIDRASQATDAVAPARADPPVVELDVVYDGPDLDETAALLGLTPAELAEQHAAAEWTVAFTGLRARLRLPRERRLAARRAAARQPAHARARGRRRPGRGVHRRVSRARLPAAGA